eukprot:gene8826-9561_t
MTKKTVNPVQRNKRMKHVDPSEDQSEEETFEVVNNPPDKNTEEEEEEDEPKDNKKKKAPTQKQAQQKGGLNWAAIAILCMFALPLLLGGFMQLMDFLYPQAAADRKVRDRVLRCYEVANPSKVAEVDKFVERYRGREHILFSQLRAKYEKYPECQY